MAYSKKNEFTLKDATLAAYAKALAHPARIAILKTLAERNACVCGDIVDSMPLAQSTVSQHLKELKEAGLVKGEIEGPRVCYCIDDRALETLSSELARFVQDLRKGCTGEKNC